MTGAAPIHLAVYLGRDLLGLVVGRAGECEAADASGQLLASFTTRAEAVEAVWQTYGGSRS